MTEKINEIDAITNSTVKSLKKRYDDIERLDDTNYKVAKYFVDSGNYALNYVCSTFTEGLPIGRIVEAAGESSTGKTAVLLMALASIQKMGGIAIIDDVERHYDLRFGKTLGIDNSKLIRVTSATVEETFKKLREIVEDIREQGFTGPIGYMLDSVGDLTTEHEQKVEFEKNDMTKAKLLKKAMRLYDKFIHENDVLFILCNHVYDNIGVMFGDKQKSSGGSGINFASSVKLRLSKGRAIKNDNGKKIGSGINVTCKKNKISPNEGKKCVIDIYFEEGINRYSGLIALLEQEGKIVKAGRSFLIEGTDIKFKKTEIEEAITNHPELLEL